MDLHRPGGLRHQVGKPGNVGLHQYDACRAQAREDFLHSVLHLRVKPGEIIAAGNTQPQPSELCWRNWAVIIGHHRVKQCKIFDSASMRADLIEQGSDWGCPIVRVAARGRPKTTDPTKGGWNTDRTLSVLSDPEGRHPRRYRCSGPSAATTRNAAQIIGVAYSSERKIVTRPAKREFVKVGLAEHTGAGCA
jgi:hypothetical protein